MDTWRAGLCCVLMCIMNQAGGVSIVLQNRTSVAFAGEIRTFDFNVTVPKNHSGSMFECYASHSQGIIFSALIPSSGPPIKVPVQWTIWMINSSSSAEFHCKCENAVVYWVVLVRDKWYEEPDEGLESEVVIPVGILTVLLLVFAVTGSICIFKDKEEQSTPRDASDAVRVGSEEEEDGEMTDGAAASASLYTGLESRPASVYEVLDQEATDKKKHKKKGKLVSKETTLSAQTEDGIFESVYENL